MKFSIKDFFSKCDQIRSFHKKNSFFEQWQNFDPKTTFYIDQYQDKGCFFQWP